MGLDGIVAKRLDETYHSGERIGMVKIKRIRTADTVVGGFRYAEKGGGVGSLFSAFTTEKACSIILASRRALIPSSARS